MVSFHFSYFILVMLNQFVLSLAHSLVQLLLYLEIVLQLEDLFCLCLVFGLYKLCDGRFFTSLDDLVFEIFKHFELIHDLLLRSRSDTFCEHTRDEAFICFVDKRL